MDFWLYAPVFLMYGSALVGLVCLMVGFALLMRAFITMDLNYDFKWPRRMACAGGVSCVFVIVAIIWMALDIYRG